MLQAVVFAVIADQVFVLGRCCAVEWQSADHTDKQARYQAAGDNSSNKLKQLVSVISQQKCTVL